MRARHMEPVLHSSRSPDRVRARDGADGGLCCCSRTAVWRRSAVISHTLVVVASSLTSLSVMLFGSRRSRRDRV